MEHYRIVTSEDHYIYMQSHLENKSFRKITNMDYDQRTSIWNKINPKRQALLRIQLLPLVQTQTQSTLMTHMTILTIWKIPMTILTLLIHKKKTWKIMSLNKTNYIKRQMMTWSLSPRPWSQLFISKNELRHYINSSQW